MAFTIEDGTAIETANAYATVEEFKEHHADRGNESAQGVPAREIQFAIIKATDYVDQRFGRRFRGLRRTGRQALEWPRISAYDNDGILMFAQDVIPRQLKRAIFEYALIIIQLGRGLLPTPALKFSTVDPSTGETSNGVTGPVKRTRERLGPLEEEVFYGDQSSSADDPNFSNVADKSSLVANGHIPEYPVADLWLEELLNSSSGACLERA